MDVEEKLEKPKPINEGSLLYGLLDLSETLSSDKPLEERISEIAPKLTQLLGFNFCLIRLFKEKGKLEVAAAYGEKSQVLDKGYSEEDQYILPALEGHPVVVSDIAANVRIQYPKEICDEGIRAFATFPIIVYDKPIGILQMFSTEPRELSEVEISLVSRVTDGMGLAIHGALMQEHQRQQIEYLMELQNVGKIISSTLSLEEVLGRIASYTVKILSLKGAMIRLFNPKTGTLDLKMSYGLSDKYIQKGQINAQKSLAEAMKGAVVVIYDAPNDERVQYRKEAAEEGIGTIISVPMLLKDKVIGVIRLFTSTPRHLSEEELTFISVLADQCAGAIENARHYENIELAYESVLRDVQRKTVLEVRDLYKSFPGVDALIGVNFALKEGEIHGLLGQNGAGKSTLIKILTGVYSMTKGRVLLDGEEVRIRDTQTAHSIGFSTIYQDTNLIETMSIAENLMMGSLPTYGPFRLVDRNRLRDTAIPLLKEVNMEIDPFTLVDQLTPGQKQMVQLAKVLLERKKIIILDEPTTSLSAAEIKTYFTVLRKLKDQGLSMIYISHILDEVLDICDQITIMRDGKIVVTKEAYELDKVEVSRLMVGRETKKYFELDTQLSAQPIFECINLASDKLAEPINLSVKGGEIVGVIGARGSGEDELVRLILGLGKRTQGKVLINSQDITEWGLSKRIANGVGFIPPERLKEGIFPNLSCMYNICLPVIDRQSHNALVNQNILLDQTNQAIKAFGIKTTGPLQEVKFLSGGNQQKVLLSKWVNAKSKFYLLCDPTAGVDVGAKDEVYELIIKLAKEGSGILFVSHDLEEVFKVCHRIVVFHKGKIVFEAQKDAIDQGKILYHLMGGVAI